MSKKSAGILLYRRIGREPEVFLVHPGGPFWANKDEAAWSIPKGEFGPDEEPLAGARREFTEETGFAADGEAIALDPLKQSSGKTIYAFAIEGDVNPADLTSNSFSMQWPPKSGKMQEFPEVDRAGWFTIEQAMHKIHKGQAPLLHQLTQLLESKSGPLE